MRLIALWAAFREWVRRDRVVIEYTPGAWLHPKTCCVRFVDGQPYAVCEAAWIKLRPGGKFYDGSPAQVAKWHPSSPRMVRHFNWQESEWT